MYVAWLFAWRARGSRVALQCLERALVLAHSSLYETRGQRLNRRSTNNDRDSEDLELPNAESRSYTAAKIIDFCLGSVAYAQFKEDLLEAVLQPYKRKVDKLLETCSVRSTGDRGFATIAQIKDELSWVPPDLIHFQSTDLFTLSDWLKERVELGMNEIWQWWPLRQRRHRLGKGWVRIGWTCVSRMKNTRYVFNSLTLLQRYAIVSTALTYQPMLPESLRLFFKKLRSYFIPTLKSAARLSPKCQLNARQLQVQARIRAILTLRAVRIRKRAQSSSMYRRSRLDLRVELSN